MPADLDQFGRKYSDGAVVRRKGLVELRHLAANGRGPVDQVNLETRSSKVKRSLNTAHPSADHHHITCEILATAMFEVFSNLVLNSLKIFSHGLSPHRIRFLRFHTSLLNKPSFAGCSKTLRCKAPEILRSEAYFDVRRNDEG